MTAPQQQHQSPAAAAAAAQQGPLSDADVSDWMGRFNDVLARPSEHLNSRSPDGARPWYASLFGCFSPLDTCLVGYFLPCVVFGRAYHRLRKSPRLEGYEPINTTCLLFCASSCVALHWIPMAMQRADLRAKHNLEGSCLLDLALSCYCGCCSIIQQDKEAEYRALGAGAPVHHGYQANGGMAYPQEPQKQ